MTALTKVFQHIHLHQDLSLAQRLFHGRGHAFSGLHHVTVDWLPPVILVTLFAPEPLSKTKHLSDQLLALFPSCKSVQLQHRYKLSGPIDLIYGEAIQQISIQQDNLQFHIHLGQSRNTGLFLDMQPGRQWVQANSKDKRVLNLFAYTCGFSVAAIAGKAESVFNVDLSRSALSVGRENHRLNQHNLKQVRFEKLDIFKSFSRFKKRGPFDLLICDPPTLQKGSVDIIKDYPKIIRRLDEFMAPESTLILCLNAPELDRDFLIDHMHHLAPKYTLIEEIHPPKVFFEAENKGLKVLCFKHILNA